MSHLLLSLSSTLVLNKIFDLIDSNTGCSYKGLAASQDKNIANCDNILLNKK